MEDQTLSLAWNFIKDIHSSNPVLHFEVALLCWIFSRNAVKAITNEIREVTKAITGHTKSIELHGEKIDNHEKRIGILEIDVGKLKPKP